MIAFLAVMAVSVATVAATPPPSECQRSISQLIGKADASTRVVVTLTGSQSELHPLDLSMLPTLEATLFPIGLDRFVLTLQFRPDDVLRAQADRVAEQLCTVASSSGARFNGVMSFAAQRRSESEAFGRERMTEALMPKLPEQ